MSSPINNRLRCKRDVEQSGGRRKRKAYSNLVHDQKRRERPKLIQGKQHREQAQESPASIAAMAGMAPMLIVSTISNTVKLYSAETVR